MHRIPLPRRSRESERVEEAFDHLAVRRAARNLGAVIQQSRQGAVRHVVRASPSYLVERHPERLARESLRGESRVVLSDECLALGSVVVCDLMPVEEAGVRAELERIPDLARLASLDRIEPIVPVGNRKDASRPEHAVYLAQCTLDVAIVRDGLDRKDGVERLVFVRHRQDVALVHRHALPHIRGQQRHVLVRCSHHRGVGLDALRLCCAEVDEHDQGHAEACAGVEDTGSARIDARESKQVGFVSNIGLELDWIAHRPAVLVEPRVELATFSLDDALGDQLELVNADRQGIGPIERRVPRLRCARVRRHSWAAGACRRRLPQTPATGTRLSSTQSDRRVEAVRG